MDTDSMVTSISKGQTMLKDKASLGVNGGLKVGSSVTTRSSSSSSREVAAISKGQMTSKDQANLGPKGGPKVGNRVNKNSDNSRKKYQ
jgi:hypothetical protein